MPEAQAPAPQPEVTAGTKPHDWKKVSLTILVIIVVSGLLVAAYWFLVLNKSSDNSDLLGPVPKVTTKTSTESAKETTPSEEKIDSADWETYADTKFNYSVNYPKGWTVVKGGGGQCVSLGGYRSEDNICFQSQDFVDESTTGMGIQVEGRPYNSDEHLIKCSDHNFFKECQELKVAGQDALKQLIRTSEIKGTLHVDEMYSFPGKNNESTIFLTITYFRCQAEGDTECTKKEDADKFISEVISSFKFIN